MEEEKVSFETAKLAKEKGFDLNVYNWFDANKNPFIEEEPIEWESSVIKNFNRGDKNQISRPTQSLLQRWLREVHKIRVYVENKTAGDFGFIIYTLNSPELCAGQPWVRNSYFTLHFKTYEEALEVGLQESLKLVKYKL